MLEHNYTWIMQHFFTYGTQAYTNIIGFFFWPWIFTVIGGYVYLKNQSVVAYAVFMLIIFAAFGNTFVNVELWVTFVQITFSLAIMGLFLIFFTKIRR